MSEFVVTDTSLKKAWKHYNQLIFKPEGVKFSAPTLLVRHHLSRHHPDTLALFGIHRSAPTYYMLRKYKTEQLFHEILVHEMVHQWQMEFTREQRDHGPRFMSWKPLVVNQGLRFKSTGY